VTPVSSLQKPENVAAVSKKPWKKLIHQLAYITTHSYIYIYLYYIHADVNIFICVYNTHIFQDVLEPSCNKLVLQCSFWNCHRRRPSGELLANKNNRPILERILGLEHFPGSPWYDPSLQCTHVYYNICFNVYVYIYIS